MQKRIDGAQNGGNGGDSYPNSVEYNEVQKAGIEMNEHLIGPALIALGENIIEARGKFKGATPGTSIASKTLSKALPYTSPTIKKITTYLFGRQASTAVLGRALGRMVPGLGWAITAIDVFEPHKPESFFGGPSKSFSGQQLTYTPSLCFVEGTEILMGDGTKKNIEDVKVGDRVKTYNFKTSTIEENKVLRVDNPMHFDIIDVGFSNDLINMNTFDHPYFVKEKGWCSYKPNLTQERYNLKVNQLEVGDVAYYLKGKRLIEVKILFITENIRNRQTYNLTEVESNNNFFANGVLVHNKFSPQNNGEEIVLKRNPSDKKKLKKKSSLR